MEGSLLTPEVRTFIRSQPWPKGVIYEIQEATEGLYIVFFRDNWLTLDADAHWRITAIVKEVIDKLRSLGIPMSTGKMERAPKND